MTEKGPALKIISLGWGVQSWAMAAMSALGELPPVDFAIHSDTTFERKETYEFAQKWTGWLINHGVQVVTVQEIFEYGAGGVMIPAFTSCLDGQESGLLRRQCTSRWKIDPVRRWVRQELARLEVKKHPGAVEQWLGITLDEFQRMKLSQVKYVKNTYPLFDKRMTRNDVILWLQRNGLEVPVKSSCVMCPYHDRRTWREIKQSGTGDWEKAIKFDAYIRDMRPNYKTYVSRQRLPLEVCDFSSQEDNGQLNMFEMDVCEGGCFL